MLESNDPLPPPYRDHADFYRRGPYSSYLVEYRSAGTAPVNMFEASQPAGEYPDPAFPNLLLYVAKQGAKEAKFDWGAGRWKGRWRTADLTLVPPDSASDVSLSEPHGFLSICIPGQSWSMADTGEARGIDLGRLHAAPFRDAFISNLCRQLWYEARVGNPQGSLFADGALLCLVARLQSLAGAGEVDRPGHGLPAFLVKRVTDHVMAHLGRDITVAELAALCGLSPGHFSRQFATATGRSPHRFVTELRLERARELVQSDLTPLAEIALATGFSSQSHLTARFRRHFGVTPGAIRRGPRT